MKSEKVPSEPRPRSMREGALAVLEVVLATGALGAGAAHRLHGAGGRHFEPWTRKIGTGALEGGVAMGFSKYKSFPPVNIPIPTKIGSKMGAPTPKWYHWF